VNPLYTEIIGSWVRTGLGMLSIVLISHHLVTATQGEALTTLWFTQIMNSIPAAISLGWGAWQKFKSRQKLVTALTMPVGTTENAVVAKIATGVGVPAVTTLASVVPLAKVGVLVLALGLSLSACAHPSTANLSPQGHVAYTADQIAARVNELENAAIAANASGGLPLRTTRTLVEFSVKADQVLAATPSGWLATLTTAWNVAKSSVSGVMSPALTAAIAAVDVVLGGLK